MKGKSIGKRIEELQEKLHPRSPIDDLSEAELKEKGKKGISILLGLVSPSIVLTHLKEKEPVVINDSERARKEYEFFIEEFLDCGRSVNPCSENLELWEALWELEKKSAKKENRRTNFGINVLLVHKADDEAMKKLRAHCKIPPLSSEHKKAIRELMSKFMNYP